MRISIFILSNNLYFLLVILRLSSMLFSKLLFSDLGYNLPVIQRSGERQ